MPTDPKKVRAQSAQLDAEITRKVAAFEADLYDVWRRLRERIVALTNELVAERGRVVSTQVNLGVARRVAQQLEAVLAESGYAGMVEDALTVMGELGKYQGLGQTRVARVEREVAWSADSLEAFRAMKLRELLEVPYEVMRSVEQTILRGIVGAQDRGELLNELMAQLDISLPQTRTIYDTALSEFSRIAVTSTSTGAADEAFLYSGPIDGLTRPFCLERVGKVYARSDIEQMDNGQLDNTLITGGGYNCRHVWVPIDKLNPMAELAGTGDYAEDSDKEDVAAAWDARKRVQAERRKKRGN